MEKARTYIDLIREGKIGVMPTDTIYGIVGSALNKQAIARIYELKDRTLASPLIILISSTDDLKLFGLKLTPTQKNIISKIWPNPISIILPCPAARFSYLHRGTKTIAFRWPKQKWLQKILAQTGPLVATSANPQGRPHAETIAQAKKYFASRVDFYADDGPQAAPASTIISLANKEIALVRQGEFKLPAFLETKRIIKKKTWPELFEAIKSGKKKFDVRLVDFEAKEGDILILEEYDPKKKRYTGRTLKKKISYILKFQPGDYPFASAEDVVKYGLQIFSLDNF